MGPVQGLDSPAYLVPGMSKWLLILLISTRLYTSVIVLNPENRLSKESCPTDMSPTAILHPRDRHCTTRSMPGPRWEGCTRGMGLGGCRRGYTGTQSHQSQDPYLVIFEA